MPYSEIEAKFLGPGKELTKEPCYKKLKSAADDCVLPHQSGSDSHRLQEKTRNNRTPVATINFRRRNCPQEDKTRTTDVLKPLCKETPGNKVDGAESVSSQALQDGKSSSLSRDDEIYSTSKAFIGPIYKPPEKKKCRERKSETGTSSGVDDKRRREEKQKFNSKKLEIDTELSQFYKEIEELENENDASQGSCKVSEPSQEQMIPYDQTNDTLKSEEENKDPSTALQTRCGYLQYLEDEPGKYPCDEQVIPTFCDSSFPSFRPEWQSVHPFVIPHGPPLPSFDYHFNIQRFDAPLSLPPNIFHGQDDCQMQNGCYVDSWNCLPFDQNDEYSNYGLSSSNVHPFRNGYSVQDESVNNGFCEIRECWRDPSMEEHNRTDRFVNQWSQEEKLNKLQKLLILLRGLPGSGKTTLSRILLGQSRDGIVFSTDDYFHHQDGYRYNVNQLGDAHDWNQSRAVFLLPHDILSEDDGERVLKKSAYRLDKPKRKRNRKGKKRNSSFSENSPATLGHLAPGSQGSSQSKGEGFEETRRESGHSFTGSLQKEAADCVNGYEEQSWQDTESIDSFQNVVTTVAWDHIPKNCFPEEEEEDLFLTLSSAPSESSASYHTNTDHLSCVVVRDGCSGMRVERHMRNRPKSALDTQDMFAETPSSFLQKTEVTDKSCPDEFAVHHQSGTRTSEEILREEERVKSNCWAFFTASLSDELQSQPYSGSWPKGPHKFVYEQRPKKDRSRFRRLVCPDSEEQLIKLISTSEGAASSGSGPEIPMEKQLRDLSPKAEMVDLPRDPETNISSTCVPHLHSPEHPVESAKGTQGMQGKICNLPPNFKLLGQTPINPEAKEKCDRLTENHGMNTFLVGEDISKIINKDETKQKMMIFDRHLPWFYLDTLHDSPRSIVQKPCSYLLAFNRVGCTVYFYKNPVTSLMLHYLSSFCILSNNKRALLIFESQKSVDRTLSNGEFVPSDVLSDQPAALCSLRISSDTQFLNERLDEELKTWEDQEPVQCLPAEDSQDLISRNRRCRGLSSKELALHPVKHFGFPGVPKGKFLLFMKNKSPSHHGGAHF
ncbi:NEDD4-binding protein 2-like 2 [Cricetulus griseus]|nr:NEDD4-binding protein 2-like 2 [Cricetulus griseus]